MKRLATCVPREIREYIWIMVLGDQILHIFDCGLVVCKLDKTPLQLFNLSMGPEERITSDEEYNLEYWNSLSGAAKLKAQRMDRMFTFSHDYSCSPTYDFTEGEKPHWGTNLSILRTCRMVYHEANRILWRSNTFSFNSSEGFSTFLGRRTSLQLHFLTKLHLIFDSRDFDPDYTAWTKTLSVPVIKGLREVHFYVAEDFLNPYDIFIRHRVLPRPFGLIKHFRLHSLREVTVIIDSANSHVEKKENLTHSKCVEWSEEIRQELLHPAAATIWQNEQTAQAEKFADSAGVCARKKSRKSRRKRCKRWA